MKVSGLSVEFVDFFSRCGGSSTGNTGMSGLKRILVRFDLNAYFWSDTFICRPLEKIKSRPKTTE